VIILDSKTDVHRAAAAAVEAGRAYRATTKDERFHSFGGFASSSCAEIRKWRCHVKTTTLRINL
jgi:hypothetical protein